MRYVRSVAMVNVAPERSELKSCFLLRFKVEIKKFELRFGVDISRQTIRLKYPTMSSTPKRQKNRDGSYTPTSPETASDGSLKRKNPYVGRNDPEDPLLAAYNNPYLAHRLPEGYVPQVAAANGPLRDFKKRQTSAKQAEKAEDGPDNPFTLRPLSRTYFDILKKRRELPVHAQRYRRLHFTELSNLSDKSFLICIIPRRFSCSLAKQDQAKRLKFRNLFYTTNFLTYPGNKSHVPSLVELLPCPSQNVSQMSWM